MNDYRLTGIVREVVAANLIVGLNITRREANEFIRAGECLLTVIHGGASSGFCIVSRSRAAKIVGVSPTSIAWYVKTGRLKAYLQPGRRSVFGYDLREVEKLKGGVRKRRSN